MTEPFIGEIQIFGFNFAPRNWAMAAGQTLAIQQNTALFSLIGVNFGGNGTTTFQLPNLASRQACGAGQGPNLTARWIGETFGDFGVTLSTDQLPLHNHGMNTFTGATNPTSVPNNSSKIGVFGTGAIYAPQGAAVQMSPQMVQPAGQGLPHPNSQPYLGLTFCIALIGNFPSFN